MLDKISVFVLNVFGISLEIIGFVLILKAIKARPSGFTSPYDHAETVMSTIRPKWNSIGIGLIIAGLGFQIASFTAICNNRNTYFSYCFLSSLP
jgi:hypothetical protein